MRWRPAWLTGRRMLLAGLFLLAILTAIGLRSLQRAGTPLTQAHVLDIWERALSWLWRAAPAYPLVVALGIAF